MKDKLSEFLKKGATGDKNWFWMLLIAVIPILLLYRILFLGELIRASDIMSQYYWGVMDYGKSWIPTPFSALWFPNENFGHDGTVGYATSLLPYRLLIYMLFPLPVNIAWEIVIHLIFAGIGTFLYCRVIGLNRSSSFFAAIFFILSSEIITLINAGHVGKINTIAWTPWVFLALEKGLQERRPFYFLLTGGALAFQFLEMHWQIAFYTCLAVGFYFIFRVINICFQSRDIKGGGKLTIYAVLMVIVFFAGSSISFLPVYSWSKTTERAGGMSYEDGMSWSMPPEELVTYLIPGFFGLSRKESGYDPGYIDIFYWGRMWFAQATDYLGILPLVLAGTALLYRRSSYTWLLASLAVITQIMALGKYTPVYRFMYEYLPGFSTFRVPKMILFLTAFFCAVLAGIGSQWLFFEEGEKKAKRIKSILYGLAIILAITAGLTIYAYLDREGLMQAYKSDLSRAFRWQLPPDIAYKRFMNIIWGSLSFMAVMGVLIAFLWLCLKERLSRVWLIAFAVLFFIVDIWSVNGRFIITVSPPKIEKNDIIRFLEKDKDIFRVSLFAGDSFYYSRFNIPMISSYLAVSEKEFAEYRDRIDLDGRLLDLMNVKYVIIPKTEFGNAPLGSNVFGKYVVVFNDDKEMAVLMNRSYLPRAYAVQQVVIEKDKDMIFNILNHPRFNPNEMAVLEVSSPAAMSASPGPSTVKIAMYSNDDIKINADMAENGFLILSEKYYPGWKAYVDGKDTKIYKANYIMRGVYLPKGTHKVEFIFDPWPYKAGLWLSSATFLFLVGAVIWRVREKTAEENK